MALATSESRCVWLVVCSSVIVPTDTELKDIGLLPTYSEEMASSGSEDTVATGKEVASAAVGKGVEKSTWTNDGSVLMIGLVAITGVDITVEVVAIL